MYTATMHYRFQTTAFAAACVLWRQHVLEAAKVQPGFVRMQFLTACPEALAIGTWQEKAHAEAFMQIGVFSRLMVELEPWCDGRPEPKIWDLLYFVST